MTAPVNPKFLKLDSFAMDDAQTVFFRRQLEEIDTQLYDVKYAKLEATELVNAKPMHPGAETYTYRQFDARGVAKITSNYANGSPRADVSGAEFVSTVKSLRFSFGYNLQEIRAAQLAGLPLDAMRAMQARRAINEGLNTIALLGNAEFNLIGLFNQPNTLSYVIPNGGGGSPTWELKTGDEVLEDMFQTVDKIPTTTKEVEHAKRLLMPYSKFRLIGRKRIGSTVSGTVNDTTVLKFFQEQRPGIEVRGALFLDTAGASGATRMMAYDPDRINMEWLLPIPFESFPPERNGMEWVTECHARCGGVVVRYPQTICYADGF